MAQYIFYYEGRHSHAFLTGLKSEPLFPRHYLIAKMSVLFLKMRWENTFEEHAMIP